MEQIKQVTYKITKIGRKWFEAVQLDKKFIVKIEINENSKHFALNETYTFSAKILTEYSKYGTTIKIYPISDLQYKKILSNQNEKEIVKWLNWIEEKANQGYLYTNGIDKVNSLNIKNYPELNNRLSIAINIVNDLKQKQKEEKEKQIQIKNSYPITYLNVSYDERFEAKAHGAKWNSSLSKWYYQGQSLPEQLKKFLPVDTTITNKDTYHLSGGSGYGCYGWTKGQIVKSNQQQLEKGFPEFLFVLSSSKQYYKYDGLSFGVGDDSGYIYLATCRKATDEESLQLRKSIEKENKIKIAKLELNKIKNYIKNNGEFPNGNFSPNGKILCDTFNIYGSGDKFIIDDLYIWYIQNNGMDGDNWSNNNIKTGGAGAIGFRIVKTTELENQLIDLEKIIE